MDPEKKSLNFFFPTKYVIPKSLKFSHWPSKDLLVVAPVVVRPTNQSNQRPESTGKWRDQGPLKITYTPQVERLEPKNAGFQKESPIPGCHFQVPG